MSKQFFGRGVLGAWPRSKRRPWAPLPTPPAGRYPTNVHARALAPEERLELYAEWGPYAQTRPRLWELRVMAGGELVQVLWRERSGVRAADRARGQGWRGNDQPPQV